MINLLIRFHQMLGSHMLRESMPGMGILERWYRSNSAHS